MPPSNPLPPKENALFKRILVSLVVNTKFCSSGLSFLAFNSK